MIRLRYVALPGDNFLVVIDRVPPELIDLLPQHPGTPDAPTRFLAFTGEVEIPQLEAGAR